MIRMGDFKYVKRLYEKDELYDLANDPDELCNIIDEKRNQSIVAIFKARMLDWFIETGDIVPNRRDLR